MIDEIVDDDFFVSADELAEVENDYRTAAARAEHYRTRRNRYVRHYLAQGWTHQAIKDATGLSRSRIAQIKRTNT